MLLFVLLLFSFVSAQGLEEQVGDFQEGLEKTKDFVEQEKYNYLADRWKELLLENKVISSFDEGFTELNFLFVILFARDYSLSLEMLFAFLLWFFTFISLIGYSGWLLKADWQKAIAGFFGALLLAHMQVFNVVSAIAVKIVFYESSSLWSIARAILVIVAFVVYLFLNKIFATRLKRLKEKKKGQKLEHDVKVLKEKDEATRKAQG